LVSVAYLYLSGLITGATSQNIALIDAYCDQATDNVYALIRNDGTTSITFNQVTFYSNGLTGGAQVTVLATCTLANTLAAGTTQTCRFNGTAVTNGFNEIRIVGPSNAVGGSIQC
jgi:hypothetical protein